MLKKLCKRGDSNSKELFLTMFLVANSLTWLFMMRRNIYDVLDILNTTSQQNLIMWGIFDSTIVVSGVVGAIFSPKVRRFAFLCLWISLGIVSSIFFYFLPYLPLPHVFLISLFWNISFGLGMPSCLAYFTDCTSFENRGHKGGLTFFVSNAFATLIIILSANFTLGIITAIAWRALGLVILAVLKPQDKNLPEKQKQVSFKLIFFDKRFLLYLIPWLMFSLIYSFQKIIVKQILSDDFYNSLMIIEAIFGMLSAIVSGVLCDGIGRKIVIIYGFISLGIAYAIVGIAPASTISWYFFSIVDGTAWGIFLLIFVLILWGDLSSLSMKNAEKYYVLGSIPFFFADFIGFLFAPYVWIPASAAFSVASFFLFLAVIPLLYASETLPEKKIRERELRQYIEKAKKAKEKHA